MIYNNSMILRSKFRSYRTFNELVAVHKHGITSLPNRLDHDIRDETRGPSYQALCE